MKLNIQLFASLNVGQTYESPTVNIVPYGYSSNAYAMKFTVSLDAQNISGNYSTITITSYMKTLGNSWGWSGFNKIYMERYTKSNSESNYTQVNSTQLRSLPTNNSGNWVNCGSWTGNIQHRSDGTCSLYVKNHLLTSTSSSYGYIPRDTEQTSEELILNPLHKSPLISITGISELNSSLSGVSDNTFVQYLSKKRFTLSTTLYDSATINGITLSNGETTITGTASPLTLDFTNKTLYTTANVLPVKAVISDSMNSTGEATVNYSNYILYIKPTITPTLTTTKRNGQLSGKVLLNLIATFYNGTIGNTTNTITVKYRFWKKGTTEPNTWITIPNGSVSVSGNNVSVSNYEIGTTDTSANNYFNFENAYDIRIQINDAFYSDSTLKGVPVGETVWDELKDRLRIKKIETPSTIISQGHKTLTLSFSSNGGNYPQYYLLAKLPPTANTNGATLGISGTLGAYIGNEKANINALIANRGGLNVYGSYVGTPAALNNSNIQIYEETDGTHAIYYVKNASYTGGCYLDVYGTNYKSLNCEETTSTPSGTLAKTLDNSTLQNISQPVILYNNNTGIQSKSYASISGLSNYKKLAITFTAYKNSDQANTGGTAHICWLDLSKKDANGYARAGIVVPYSNNHLSSGAIQPNDFKALFEADVNNNRVYCLFGYSGSVQISDNYVMTKIEGYY